MKLKVTLFILLANIIYFIVITFQGNSLINLVNLGGLFVVNGHPSALWRVITYGFMHENISHLLWNMTFGIFILGYIELQYDSKATLITWIGGIVVGGIAFLYLTNGTMVVTGASAGIYAIMGGLFIRLLMEDRLNLFIIVILVGATLYSLWFTSVTPHINKIGHYVGYLTGVTITLPMYLKRRIQYE